MGVVSNLKAPVRGAAPKKQSKYAGIKAAATRDPMPPEGKYIFAIDSLTESRNRKNGNESVKVAVRAAWSSDERLVGNSYTLVFLTNGTAGEMGLGRLKAMIIAGAGFHDEESYDAFDPYGEFIAACTGEVNERANDENLVTGGRLIYCDVARGNPTKDGRDYYREYAWSPVDQETGQVIEPPAQEA